MADAKVERHTYYSLDDFAEVARSQMSTEMGRKRMERNEDRDKWTGGSLEQAFEWISQGWEEGLQEAMPLVDSALKLVDQEFDYPEFTSNYDVSGCEVDVSRFLAGVPENMLEYELTPVSKVGKVITLCASVMYSSGVSVQQCLKRGAAITALATALQRCGHEVELWADFTCGEPFSHTSKVVASTRVLVKGCHDVVDPSRIAYAYANPTFLRQLLFLEWLSMPADVKKAVDIGGCYGNPQDCIHDLPDGTIYLPTLNTGQNSAESGEKMIMGTLRKIGLID